MNMIIKLGWKNVWRNPVRSGVVITAVLLGTWAGIFLAAFTNGMTQQYVSDHLNTYLGHVQLQNPMFQEERLSKYNITNVDEIEQWLKEEPRVTQWVKHSLAPGLASSSANSFGVTIKGVDPENEARFSDLPGYIQQGSFFGKEVRNPVVIGRKLAKELDIELGSKLILNFQDVDTELTAGAFKVVGIFETTNTSWDKNNVLVNKSDLNRLLGASSLTHSIMLRIKDFKQADRFAKEVEAGFPGLRVESWGDAAPELRYMDEMMDVTIYIFMIIIIIALTLGILNTMLMVIMERTRELGMLMAVGMGKLRIFSMVVLETVFLTLVGAPGGLLLGYATNTLFGTIGINLSGFSEGLSAYGYATMVYPELTGMHYLNITLLIAAAALIAAIYPSYKALQLKPVEAIRKV